MSNKRVIWLTMLVGSVIGGYIPILFGGSGFSFGSVLGSALGGLLGIWLGFTITR